MKNKDDVNRAIDGLQDFMFNYCMNVAETERQNDLVFRCKGCKFKKGSICLVKEFAIEHNRDMFSMY